MRSFLHRLVLVSLFTLSLAAPGIAQEEENEGPPPVKVKAVVTQSGLKIYEIEKGIGSPVWRGMRVKIHYTGWVEASGKMFDSSVKRGKPISFNLGEGEMIKGVDEGVKGMRVGGKRRLVIPPDLGYGHDGTKNIPPNSTLVFDIELVGIG